MTTIDIIEKMVRGFIEDIQHPSQKKKINTNDLEYQLRQQISDYYDMDGYSLFYMALDRLTNEKIITPILNKAQNGKTPELPLYYWVQIKQERSKWDRLEMFKLGDVFQFTYYENHPEWQTEAEWQRVSNLCTFLKQPEQPPLSSVEERCLELFGHEKFLIDEMECPEGKDFLKRIGVGFEDLRCFTYEEPFVYWLKPGTELGQIKRILIVESLSFFHTSIHLLEKNTLDYEPEMIIYGDGSKIINSFSFFFRMFPEKTYLFYYAGAIDAESYTILQCLIDQYNDCCIQPAIKIYRKMLECHSFTPHKKGLKKNSIHRDNFFQWFSDEEQKMLTQLWEEDKRIPQEVLTIETWRRWM